jgi:hypothetical protein
MFNRWSNFWGILAQLSVTIATGDIRMFSFDEKESFLNYTSRPGCAQAEESSGVHGRIHWCAKEIFRDSDNICLPTKLHFLKSHFAPD